MIADSAVIPAVKTEMDDKPKPKFDPVIRRTICRYGHGCTHSHDAIHRDKFWHPSLPKLNGELTDAVHVAECITA